MLWYVPFEARSGKCGLRDGPLQLWSDFSESCAAWAGQMRG